MAENRCNELSSSSSSSSSPMIVDSNRGNNELKTNTNSLNAPKYGTPVPNRVFVGGIPSEANETEVRQLFAQYGTVVSVKIISDRGGVPRGYGFVTFETEDDAQKVIQENDNLFIRSKKLNVSVAIKKQQYGYELNPRLMTSSALIYNPFLMNATNSFYPEMGLFSAEGIPLYQVGVSPQLVGSGGSSSTPYPYTYQNSGLYLATQPSLPSLPSQFQSSTPSGYQFGCGAIRLPLTSQNNMTPNMNVNHPYIQLSSATSPLSQSSLQIPSSIPLQVATAPNPNAINNDCGHNSITGAINSAMSSLSFIPSPLYAISSNIPISNSTQMACVQNVQLKADNIELCSDSNGLMPANAMSPQMVEILWPQRVPNIHCPNTSAAINRYHYSSSKSHNDSNTSNASPINRERRNNSSFNTSQQRKLGNSNGNNRYKPNSYGSQNRNLYVSAADNDSQTANNHESYQSSAPNSAALQGQPFVKQYSHKVQSFPLNKPVVNNSQQPLGPKHNISGQTYIPKVVNGVQVYVLANLSGGDVEAFTSGSPLTPPLTPGSHSTAVKAVHKV